MGNKGFKSMVAVLILFFSYLPIWGQVNWKLLENTRNMNVTFTVMDQENDEALPFASAYLIPKGDTTIVDFTLSDKEGKVLFKQIPAGSYELNIEMMGYLPYKKVHKFNDWTVDLGKIELETDHTLLKSARVTAAGNPIRVVKDTIEFTASAFRVGQNAMLEDLLKKMPGMEIENGTVKLNGEAIDRITVGGKTFFFNDQSAALKNLPARIIEKIKVIDREKEEAAFSGVASKDQKEKIMDVGLKQEFKKGWFGNLGAAGGININSDKDNELMEKTGLIYNANGMLSGYTDKDQVVFLGNGQNNTGGTDMVYSHIGGMRNTQIDNPYSHLQGLTTSAMAGVNYNTQRWKGMEVSSSVKYDYSNINGKRKSYRTSFQQKGPDLNSTSRNHSYGHQNEINFNVKISNTGKKKFLLDFNPYISYLKNQTQETNFSETSIPEDQKEQLLNENNTQTSSRSSIFNDGFTLRTGIRDLGKEKRSLVFGARYSFGKTFIDSDELTELLTFDPSGSIQNKNIKDLNYRSDHHFSSIQGDLTYTEPIKNDWLIQGKFFSSFNTSKKSKDAFNADHSLNDYYSSLSDNQFLQEDASVVLQYKNEAFRFQAGGHVSFSQNIIHTKSLGEETESGKGKWDTKFSPELNFYYFANGHRLMLYYNGWTSPVAGDQIIPTLNLKDPLQLRTGNVYLKSYFSNNLYLNYNYNNKKTFTYLGLDIHVNNTLNGISDAIWFDENGVRYAVPVNMKKPQNRYGLNLNLNQPFGPEKHFSFSTNIGCGYNSTSSYQAKERMDGFNVNEFDYNEFMSEFWGDASGDRFYSGKSGFIESNTYHLNSYANLGLKYTGDVFDLSFNGKASNNRSHYSFDSKANTDTWNFNLRGDAGVRPGKEWEIRTNFNYCFYKGYAEGYGLPQLLWNLTINKEIKAFTISLEAVDLLNQTRNFSHLVSNEYVEDTYVNAFGRYITLGLTWNFGKKGANQNKRVRQAIFKMN